MAGRGRNANGEKKRWSATRKAKDKGFSVVKENKEKKPEAAIVAPKPRFVPKGRPKGKKSKRKKPTPVKEETGDVIVEHDFSDSEDEETAEIIAAAVKRQKQEAAAAARGKLQIFVGGLPWTAEEEAIKKYFSKCGTIVEISCPKDSEGRQRGIAFITFENEECVAKGLLLNEKDYEARKLVVKVATNKQDRAKSGSGRVHDSDDDSSPDEGEDDYSDSDGGGGGGKGKGRGKGKGGKKGKGKDKVKGKGKCKSGTKGKGTG